MLNYVTFTGTILYYIEIKYWYYSYLYACYAKAIFLFLDKCLYRDVLLEGNAITLMYQARCH